MRLLIFIHSLSAGGAERATTNLANYWAENGWDITLLTMAGCEQDFYPLHPNIKRITLNLDKDSSNLLSAIISNFVRISTLRRVLKQHQPDVALAMMTTANILLAFAAKGLKCTAIGSERIHPPMYPLGRAWEWLRRKAYGQLAAVTALTEESSRWLIDQTSVQQAPVIANAVSYPLAIHKPCIKPELSSDYRYHLISVGRLTAQKGFDRLLQAFAELAPDFPEWNLTILGEGAGRESLEQLRRELGLEQRVLMPGAVGNPGEWYEAADIYIMSSLYEGFPNTLVEAMACGLPVVSVDCDTGPRDIIRHKIDGLLVVQDSHEALVEALASLMSHQVLREQYASKAIDIRQRLSLHNIAERWESLFKEVIN